MTVSLERCLSAGDFTLVFIDGQAELTEVGTEEHLELWWTTDDGAGVLASVSVGDSPVTPIGYILDPEEWTETPPNGCEGP